ncbi:MAG TPA: response regulator [Polyangiaceae bacterium]|nr:response regulator [Polyangiaceae bacterium]
MNDEEREATTPRAPANALPHREPEDDPITVSHPLMRYLLSKLDTIERQLEDMRSGAQSIASAVTAIHELQMSSGQVRVDDVVVLLVDDEWLLRSTLTRVIKASGGTVLSAPSVVEAENLLAREHVDVAVVDIRLSDGSNGFVLAERLVEGKANVGVVLMTGLLLEPDRVAAERLGIRVLEKPVSNETFVQAVKEAYLAKQARVERTSGGQ